MSWIYGYDYTDGDSARPARERFSDPRALYKVFETFRRYDIKDQERRARILAIYNKNRPYKPEELEKIGQKWRTNLNFGALANAVDARAGAVARIATETCSLVSLESPVPQFAGPEDEAVTTVIEEEFSRAIRLDGRVIPQLALANKEADLYGCGPVTWRDPEDYVPQALRRGQVLFDPEGPTASADHEIIMVDTELSATEAFRVVDNPDMAASAGWNVEAMKKWIVRVFREDFDTRSDTSAVGGVGVLESMLETMRRNDYFEANQFRKFHVLFVFVREMAAPRKITQIIVPANDQLVGDDCDKEFLYKKQDAYDTMDDVFFWFCPDLSKHYIRSARGIASDVAPKSAVKDRVCCAMVDGVIRAMSLVVRQQGPGASPVTSLQEVGPYTVIGQDFEAVPNANQMSNFQSAVSVVQMLDQESTGSLAGMAFGATVPRVAAGGDRQSKAEAEIAERRQTQRDDNYMTSRLAFHRLVWRGTFRRFMKIATGPDVVCREYPHVQEFKERCEKRGVDKATLREALKTFQVDVSREVMLGMDGLTQLIADALAQFGGTSDEPGRKRMAHDVIRFRLGPKLANRYFPIESRDNGPSNDASVATLENNALQAGQPVLVGPDQRQLAHINVHMQVLQSIQEQVQNGIAEAQREWEEQGQMEQSADGNLAPKIEDPERLMQVLVATSQHIQEHLAIFSVQPNTKEEAQRVSQVLTGMGDVTQALNLAIATQRRVREAEEEKRQRELEELQRAADEAEIAKANHKADLDAQNARHKIDLDHQVALERLRMEGEIGRQRLAIEADSARGKQRIAFETARNDALVKSEQARGDMARRDAESRQSMELNRASAEQEARIRAGEAAQNRLEGRRAIRSVTGRETPQPADLADNGASGGVVPL
jgi:hypothetical protein